MNIPPIASSSSRSKTSSLQNSADSEPTEEWTIEELLQWCHQKSQLAVSQKTGALMNALEQQYIDAERDIWELHRKTFHEHRNSLCSSTEDEDASMGKENDTPSPTEEDLSTIASTDEKIIYSGNDDSVEGNNSKHTVSVAAPLQSTNGENADPNAEPQTEKAQSTQKSNSSGRSTSKGIHIDVLSGPHQGATYLLKPRRNRPCEIGRSKGKKFRERGMSLHMDSEVSTSHGKFELRGGGVTTGKLYFTDTGSTNGTSYLGAALEDHAPLELVTGMVLIAGESELKITLVN